MERFLIKRVGRRKQGAHDNPLRYYMILDLEAGKILLDNLPSYAEALEARKILKQELKQELEENTIKDLQEKYASWKRKPSGEGFLDGMVQDVIQNLASQEEPVGEEQLEALRSLGIPEEHYIHLLRCKLCPDQAKVKCDECSSWFCPTHLELGLFRTVCNKCLYPE